MGRPCKVYTQEEIERKLAKDRERCRKYRATEKGREASRRCYQSKKAAAFLATLDLSKVSPIVPQGGVQ